MLFARLYHGGVKFSGRAAVMLTKSVELLGGEALAFHSSQLVCSHKRSRLVAGGSASFCVEAHLRGLVERGLELAAVQEATAAAKLPEGDGYHRPRVNFRYMASAVSCPRHYP